MEMYGRKIRQTDFRLNTMINEYGCYAVSNLGMVQTHTGVLLSIDQILDIYKTALKENMMTEDCILNSLGAGGGVANLGLRSLGYLNLNCSQVGTYTYKTNKTYFWGGKEYNHTVLLGATYNDNKHYREGNKEAEEIFDPRPTVKIKEEIMIIYYLIK